jgi:hypothetical protein
MFTVLFGLGLFLPDAPPPTVSGDPRPRPGGCWKRIAGIDPSGARKRSGSLQLPPLAGDLTSKPRMAREGD